jgi:hypothetical protein
VYEMNINQALLPELELEPEEDQKTPDEDADEVPEEEDGTRTETPAYQGRGHSHLPADRATIPPVVPSDG